MKIIQYLLFVGFIFGMATVSSGQEITVLQSNKSGIYKEGEPVKVVAILNDLQADSVSVGIRKNYGEEVTQKMKYSGDTLVLFDQKIKGPASLIFKVGAGNKYAGTGLVVEPEKFKPATGRPFNFNRFWKKEKKALRSLPLEIKSTPVEIANKGFECLDVEINCTGSKPARGYFVKPASAQPGTLPVVLNLHAAGVNGSWCLAQPDNALFYAKMGEGALVFDLNAHGMLNGQSQQYYDDLAKGELKNYWETGMENRDEFYFRGMYLRLIRTLDFLCSQPEWDGKRIIVIGESQGGGQALAAAGLDPRVSAAVATVPAMCDFGRTLAGEKGGWPNPFGYSGNKHKMKKTLPYFDAAHLLKKSKAEIVAEIGFIDMTCPSSSVYAAVNQSKGKVTVLGVPYRSHQMEQKQFEQTWRETVYNPKMKFIKDFLE